MPTTAEPPQITPKFDVVNAYLAAGATVCQPRDCESTAGVNGEFIMGGGIQLRLVNKLLKSVPAKLKLRDVEVNKVYAMSAFGEQEECGWWTGADALAKGASADEDAEDVTVCAPSHLVEFLPFFHA